MKLKDAGITILTDEDKVIIELHDNRSSIIFAEVELTPKQFCAALSRLSNTPCEIEVKGLDKLGKTLEIKDFIFEIAEEWRWERTEGKVITQGLSLCPAGWVMQEYFRAQGSYFNKNGKTFAKTTIRRWID